MTSEICDQIDQVIAERKVMSLRYRCKYYLGAAHALKRRNFPSDSHDGFSGGVLDIATRLFEWDENPPVWYHGGPSGLQPGDPVLCCPRVPISQNYRYFTLHRQLADLYARRNVNGAVYRVQPEGEIEVDPVSMFFAAIIRRDPDINLKRTSHSLNLVHLLPSWRARAAHFLGMADE